MTRGIPLKSDMLSLLVLGLAFTVAFSGCSGSSASLTTDTSSPEPTSGAVAAASPSPSREATTRVVFKALEDGLSIAETTDFGTAPNVSILRIDPTKARIRAIDVVTSVQSAFSYPTYSIREVYQILHPLAIISGGNSVPSTIPQPDALLVDDRGMVSRMNTTKGFATGVFCIFANGRAAVLHKTDSRVGSCKNALQSGPILVEATGQQGMTSDDLKRPAYGRSVVALDASGSVYFIVTDDVHLFNLADALRKPVASGGLGISVAMALGRDSGHAGMLYALGGGPSSRQKGVGLVDATLPSALAIFRQ